MATCIWRKVMAEESTESAKFLLMAESVFSPDGIPNAIAKIPNAHALKNQFYWLRNQFLVQFLVWH
jgi:hypothetical protein